MAENLTPKQRRAIAALVSGQDFGQAAADAGVSVRTLHRWRTTPEFAAELRGADSEQLNAVARTLNGASHDAVSVLVEIMRAPETSPALRLRAAGEILKHRASFFELLTLEQRLSELEQRLGQQTGSLPGES